MVVYLYEALSEVYRVVMPGLKEMGMLHVRVDGHRNGGLGRKPQGGRHSALPTLSAERRVPASQVRL